uniref:ionotropic receptor 157 n=1 Tax=Aedes aegypti TaxID=7159 RepID=UPI000C20FE57|nr:ionotropic receptor 157 [Aedes aegypti]
MNRILREGLKDDHSTTTDVLFVNFVEPEYVELQDAVIEGLRNETSLATMFMNSRNRFARNRLFLLVATPSLDSFLNSFDTVLRPTITDQQLVENSHTVHVIAIVLNCDLGKQQFMHLMAYILGWFKTHQLLMVVSTPSEAQIFSAARNKKLYILHWNASFYDLFYNKPFENLALQYFAAVPSVPRVFYQDGNFDGLDVTVFNTITAHLNISYKIIYVTHPNLTVKIATIEQLYKNGTISGLINRSGGIEKTVALMALPYQDGQCILVPKSQRKYLFYHLLQPLAPSSWLLLCGLVFIAAFVSAFWSRWFHQNLVLSLFCGSTVRNHRMQRLERFVVVGGAFLFTILIEAYLAKFIFHMTTYRYERDSQTIDEFVESPHMLLVQPVLVEMLLEMRSDFENKLIAIPDLGLEYDIINNTRYGYIVPCMIGKAKLVERAAYDRLIHGTNVRPPFYLIPEKLQTEQLFYQFAAYSLHFAHFKRCFDRLFETGLTDFWEKKFERQYYVNPAFEYTDTVVLDMDRLHLLWIIYGIGNVASLLTFVGELVMQSKRCCAECVAIEGFAAK